MTARDLVDGGRAAPAGKLPVGPVHHVLDDEVVATLERVAQAELAVRPVEAAIGGHLDHRQPPPCRIERVALAGGRRPLEPEAVGEPPAAGRAALGEHRQDRGLRRAETVRPQVGVEMPGDGARPLASGEASDLEEGRQRQRHGEQQRHDGQARGSLAQRFLPCGDRWAVPVVAGTGCIGLELFASKRLQAPAEEMTMQPHRDQEENEHRRARHRPRAHPLREYRHEPATEERDGKGPVAPPDHGANGRPLGRVGYGPRETRRDRSPTMDRRSRSVASTSSTGQLRPNTLRTRKCPRTAALQRGRGSTPCAARTSAAPGKASSSSFIVHSATGRAS